MNLKGGVTGLVRGEEGASLPEYALLLALILVVTLAAIAVLGARISTFFAAVSTTI